MEKSNKLHELRTSVRTIFFSIIKLVGIIVLGSIVGVVSSESSLHMELLQFAILLLCMITSVHINVFKPIVLLPYILLIWVISPEIRRLIDWSFQSYSNPSIISLVPYCVSLILLLPIIKNIKFLDNRIKLICKVFGIALIYGFSIGFLKYGMSAVYDLLNYIVPILVLVYVNVCQFDSNVRDKWLRSFSYFGVIIAVYGIYQYIVLPPWDEFWMINAKMNSIGLPNPQNFRVFSLLNSPGPTGVFLGLALAIMTVQKKWRACGMIGIMIVAFALLLTLVRVGWIAYIIMIIAYFIRAQLKSKIQLLALSVILTLAFVFVLPILPGANNVASRINTFSSLEEDHSLNERLSFSNNILSEVLTNPIGKGLGSSGLGAKLTSNTDTLVAFDNGYLNIFYTFGLPLGLAIFAIFMYLALYLFKLSRREKVYVPISFAAICAVLFLLMASNVIQGVSGLFLWFIISLTFIPRSSNREES
jgi:putative inorganic carbon (HCO3(-)) transporter